MHSVNSVRFSSLLVKTSLLLLLLVALTGVLSAASPNFIVIFCDDLGYGDIGCYGSTKNRTPHIDSLAKDGRKFTDFYSSSPVCTPSRSSLMTGCYARRVGMHEDSTGHWVLIPRSRRGMNPDELTIAEALQSKGYASPDFHGKSANGRYGDSVEEIDWSTGEILKCLERLKLAENTLVIFTSDNGSNGHNGGSNAPLSGRKGSTMEGGMRVPMLARWPGKISAGTECSALSTTMDFLPTFSALAGAELSKNKIDGYDIAPLLFGKEGAKTPYEALFYYRRRQLQAVRMGDWKLHLDLAETHPNWANSEVLGKARPGKLVNLATDLQETTDVASEHPEVVNQMTKLVEQAVAELGNDEKQGSGQRNARTLEKSAPMVRRQE